MQTVPIEGVLFKYGVEFNPDRDGNQQVCCPFHDDSHASASVNLGKGLFKCFGCDVTGDAIALLMKQEGMEFVEAQRIAQELAGEAGSAVSRVTDRGSSLLPRRQGARPGRRQWKSPWAGSRPGPGS